MTELREPQTEIPVSRKTLWFSFAGAFAFLYLRTFLLPNIPFAVVDDQSLFFARAEHMVQGQIPYRDFFEIVTPGTELLYSAAFRLFGIHAWIMPAWAIAVGLAFYGLITFIANKVLRGTSVWFPAWLFLIFDFNSGLDMTHHWFSTFAALAAAAVLMDGLNPRRILASSFLCAIAVLFTQTKGTLVFFAIALYLVYVHRSKTRGTGIWLHLTIFIFPFLLIATCVLGYYIHLSGLHTVCFDLIEYPVKFMTPSEGNRPETYFQEMGQSFHVHSIAQAISLISVLFVYVLVPYVYIAGLYELWRGRGRFSIQLWQKLFLLHLVGLALFLAIVYAPRHFRLCTVAPPAILIFVWLLSREGRARRYVRNILWILTAFYAIVLSVHRQTQWHGMLNLPIGLTAFSDEEEFREFQWVALRTHPTEALFNQSALDLYLSLENPAGMESVSYDEITRPEQITALLHALQRKPLAYIVAPPLNPASGQNEGHAGPFIQYLDENYRLAAVFPLDHSLHQQGLWEHKPSSQSGPQ